MKKIVTTIFLALATICLHAQSAQLPTGLTLDTLEVKKKLEINDYSMFGVSYGANLSMVRWNPGQSQDMLLLPMNVGISFTKYGRMFGYMPYFGFKIGLNYTQEGYQFEYNEEKNYTYKIEGAEKAVYDVVEMPMYMHCHYDMWNFKLIAELGCYAGYRLGIQRFSGNTGYVTKELEYSFLPTDRRLDYGLKGGVGFGLVFDPLEFHIMATYKHSFSSLYDPDHKSEYYYRYAYPMNISVTAGVYIHLSKRTGKTKAELKKEAKDLVYNSK